MQNAAEFYAGLMLAITASNQAGEQSQKEIEGIRRKVNKTGAMLKQITTETASMVEEQDIIFLTMQLMACID